MDDPLPLTPAAQIIAGLLVLFLGRRLFWLFVGVAGFFFGLQFGMKLFNGMADWLLLLVSILLGAVCAGLSILLQRLAVAIAGGVVGGMIAIRLAPLVGLHSEQGLWVAFVIGAFLAAVLLSVMFDPMLIFLSATIGAVMIAEAPSVDPMIEPIILAICFIAGVAVQFRTYLRSRPLVT
jgi:hypothetical protein